MKNALHRPLVPLALAAALALSACSNEEPATFEDTGAQAAQQAQETSAGAGQDQAEPDDQELTDDQPADQAGAGATEAATGAADAAGATAGSPADEGSSEGSAAAAGVEPAELGEPIGTAVVPATVSGDPEATMEVSLYSLQRDGSTVVGTYSFTVHSEDGDDDARWIYHYLGDASWAPFLVDTTNLTRHDVLGESATRAMTDFQGAKFRPGTTFYAYASFAAPPEGVTTMTAYVVDGAPAIPDVEIQ